MGSEFVTDIVAVVVAHARRQHMRALLPRFLLGLSLFLVPQMHTCASAAAEFVYTVQPPADLLFQGSFDALRKKAAHEQKYCIVNIQKRQEVASQMLNRDTWPDENVRTIVGFRFVFWQQDHESQAGIEYRSCYPANTLPIVDIIDPITGGLAERIEEYQSGEQMAERLTRFADSHHFYDTCPGAPGKSLLVFGGCSMLHVL